VRLHLKQDDGSIEQMDVPGYPVEICNILGAGDAFGGRFLYRYVNDWGWYKSARLVKPGVVIFVRWATSVVSLLCLLLYLFVQIQMSLHKVYHTQLQ
jgi:hypothetical protein